LSTEKYNRSYYPAQKGQLSRIGTLFKKSLTILDSILIAGYYRRAPASQVWPAQLFQPVIGSGKSKDRFFHFRIEAAIGSPVDVLEEETPERRGNRSFYSRGGDVINVGRPDGRGWPVCCGGLCRNRAGQAGGNTYEQRNPIMWRET
jgi:hypothetical protein